MQLFFCFVFCIIVSLFFLLKKNNILKSDLVFLCVINYLIRTMVSYLNPPPIYHENVALNLENEVFKNQHQFYQYHNNHHQNHHYPNYHYHHPYLHHQAHHQHQYHHQLMNNVEQNYGWYSCAQAQNEVLVQKFYQHRQFIYQQQLQQLQLGLNPNCSNDKNLNNFSDEGYFDNLKTTDESSPTSINSSESDSSSSRTINSTPSSCMSINSAFLKNINDFIISDGKSEYEEPHEDVPFDWMKKTKQAKALGKLIDFFYVKFYFYNNF